MTLNERMDRLERIVLSLVNETLDQASSRDQSWLECYDELKEFRNEMRESEKESVNGS